MGGGNPQLAHETTYRAQPGGFGETGPVNFRQSGEKAR
jgi:hypothetical protein